MQVRAQESSLGMVAAVRGQDQNRCLAGCSADEQWQLAFLNLGHNVVPPEGFRQRGETRPKLQNVDEYRLVFVCQGKADLNINRTAHAFGAGDAFLAFPGVPYFYVPDASTGLSEYWVTFRGSQMNALVRNGFFSPTEPLFPQSLDATAVREFRQMIEETTAAAPGYRLVVASRILVLLARLQASRRARNGNENSSVLVGQVQLALEEQVTSCKLDLTSPSRSCGLSVASLSTAFRASTGVTPHKRWIDLKIDHAKELLLSEKPVKVVAYELGFECEFYFSRIFKKKTGLPPSLWPPRLRGAAS